ncbi:MAG: D-alanine--D-alanine ligase [Oscillibacter sp.]
MKIVVLAGGLSSERAVSLATGTGVCRALRANGHQAILVDVFLGLEEHASHLEALFDAADGLCGNADIASTAPDLERVRKSRADQGPGLVGPGVFEICALADIVFLGLHGQDGEDGRIQAAFDLLGIRYTGSGYLASGMAMDKAVTKRMMDAAGVRTPAWQLLHYGPEDVERLTQELPMPCVVKTTGGGSSLGVYLPETREALGEALTEVLSFGETVLVEQRIYGVELAVGVLGDRCLPAVEIRAASGSFDYAAKYQSGGAQEICPARISEAAAREAADMTLRLHQALGLSVYSRADLILDDKDQPWCLEINSLPGLTAASLVPKGAAAVGLSYPQLCEEIVEQSYRLKRRN